MVAQETVGVLKASPEIEAFKERLDQYMADFSTGASVESEFFKDLPARRAALRAEAKSLGLNFNVECSCAKGRHVILQP